MSNMAEHTAKDIAVCPSCKTKYRFSSHFLGKTVLCKKCGIDFVLVSQAAQDHPPPAPSSNPGPGTEDVEEKREKESPSGTNAFEITVSEDNMTAFLHLVDDSPNAVTLEQIKELLKSGGVRFGLIADEVLEQDLGNWPPQGNMLEVARGESPVPGEDARITYYFDTDPLKIGTLRHGGTIDFRDRGEIPQVSKGTLLAKKEPAVRGTPGMDVFGMEIHPPQPKDTKLRCGKGTIKSEDGLTAHAAQDGSPTLSADGKLTVLSKLQIPGDVGLETGHVHFDGDITVGGSIQDGFRVNGGRLSAGETLRADITVSGDITVAGGIIGTTIRGDGNLMARYIRDARVQVLGDVVVQKEVIDSDILSSGALLIEAGKVFNSRISSKKGIVANQIGSDESKPCALNIGIDDGARVKIENLKARKRQKKAKSKKFEKIAERLRTVSNQMHGEIAELAQVQDRGMLEQKDLKADVDKLKKEENEEEISRLLVTVTELDSKIHSAELRLAKRMGQQEKVLEKADDLEKKAQEFASECTAIREEMDDVHEWSQSTGSDPVVKVRGEIFSHTTIKGPHTSAELKETLTRSIIREKEIAKSERKRAHWKLVVNPLK